MEAVGLVYGLDPAAEAFLVRLTKNDLEQPVTSFVDSIANLLGLPFITSNPSLFFPSSDRKSPTSPRQQHFRLWRIDEPNGLGSSDSRLNAAYQTGCRYPSELRKTPVQDHFMAAEITFGSDPLRVWLFPERRQDQASRHSQIDFLVELLRPEELELVARGGEKSRVVGPSAGLMAQETSQPPFREPMVPTIAAAAAIADWRERPLSYSSPPAYTVFGDDSELGAVETPHYVKRSTTPPFDESGKRTTYLGAKGSRQRRIRIGMLILLLVVLAGSVAVGLKIGFGKRDTSGGTADRSDPSTSLSTPTPQPTSQPIVPGTMVRVLRGHTQPVFGMIASPKGDRLYSIASRADPSNGNQIFDYNILSWSVEQAPNVNKTPTVDFIPFTNMISLSFDPIKDPEGESLFVCTQRKDGDAREETRVLNTRTRRVESLDSTACISDAKNGTHLSYDFEAGTTTISKPGEKPIVLRAGADKYFGLSPDGDAIAFTYGANVSMHQAQVTLLASNYSLSHIPSDTETLNIYSGRRDLPIGIWDYEAAMNDPSTIGFRWSPSSDLIYIIWNSTIMVAPNLKPDLQHNSQLVRDAHILLKVPSTSPNKNYVDISDDGQNIFTAMDDTRRVFGQWDAKQGEFKGTFNHSCPVSFFLQPRGAPYLYTYVGSEGCVDNGLPGNDSHAIYQWALY
ncbi:uncharacterized protein EV422DRAFT_571414 [Fimicolochytrium jonesii]|uniref:uncharacterized protein n=1 Tax=Fimicolochytrium jonesii TaxID=1396493 RepID=UPI0022FE0DC7|nr:uncharacterized protein EV422DRAFT_571414 [Fimicolochytrium jonesii]KAI8816887.1 hypothetical protein EV422DRAFT_571414 [Fimicolochytrium jonesii]